MDDERRKSIVFVLRRTASGNPSVVGTGFIYAVPDPEDQQSGWLYAITAGHVVAPPGEYAVRLQRSDGTGQDIEIDPDNIFHHPSADVAAISFGLGDPSPQRDALDIALAHEDSLVHISSHVPSVGDSITIAGLFGLVPAMHSGVVPISRGGTLASPLLPDIPMRYPDGCSTSQAGYLVDCASLPGFSGAPCFVRIWHQPTERTPRLGLHYAPQRLTYVLGVAGGHFDDTARISVGEEEVGVPRPTGIAVVYPSTTVSDLMALPEVIEGRTRG